MKKQPLVSVIMPVYNGARFVGKAIESILNQTYPRWELLIADAGSIDDTWTILKHYKKIAPTKIRIFRLHKNGGAYAVANYVYQFAKGAYIAPMDADDVANRQRLQKQVECLEIHPETILVGSSAKIIDARGRITGYKNVPTNHGAIYQAFAFVNPIIHPSCMIKKSMLPRREFLYHTNFGVNSDYYTLFEWLNYGKFANLSEHLLSYRIHGTNSSLSNLKEKFWIITKVRLAAVTKLNYRAPWWMFPAMLLQAIPVLLLPEPVLRELFFYLRGIKRVKLPVVLQKAMDLPHLPRLAYR